MRATTTKVLKRINIESYVGAQITQQCAGLFTNIRIIELVIEPSIWMTGIYVPNNGCEVRIGNYN